MLEIRKLLIRIGHLECWTKHSKPGFRKDLFNPSTLVYALVIIQYHGPSVHHQSHSHTQ